MAVRVVDGFGVEEDNTEAAARSRRAMERFTRGAGVVAKVFWGTCSFLEALFGGNPPFSHHPGVREADLFFTHTHTQLRGVPSRFSVPFFFKKQ